MSLRVLLQQPSNGREGRSLEGNAVVNAVTTGPQYTHQLRQYARQI